MYLSAFTPVPKTELELSEIAEESNLDENTKFTQSTENPSYKNSPTTRDSVIFMLQAEIDSLRNQLLVKEQERSKEIQQIKMTVQKLEIVLFKEVKRCQRVNLEVMRLQQQNSQLRNQVLAYRHSNIKCSSSWNPPKIAMNPPYEIPSSIKAHKNSKTEMGGSRNQELVVSQTGNEESKTTTRLNERRSIFLKQKLKMLDREIQLSREKLNNKRKDKCYTQN